VLRVPVPSRPEPFHTAVLVLFMMAIDIRVVEMVLGR
jgi:hypothetical protein